MQLLAVYGLPMDIPIKGRVACSNWVIFPFLTELILAGLWGGHLPKFSYAITTWIDVSILAVSRRTFVFLAIHQRHKLSRTFKLLKHLGNVAQCVQTMSLSKLSITEVLIWVRSKFNAEGLPHPFYYVSNTQLVLHLHPIRGITAIF